jgi:hypothetical protein
VQGIPRASRSAIFCSIKHKPGNEELDCGQDAEPLAIGANDEDVSIVYSYSVIWEVLVPPCS